MDEHILFKCDFCEIEFEKEELEKHKVECPKKPRFCKFCKNNFRYDEFDNHIYICSSRTK